MVASSKLLATDQNSKGGDGSGNLMS